MCVSIITLTTIAISLSDVNISFDKTFSIKAVYDNIRKEFGIALDDRLSTKLELDKPLIPLIRLYFNDTEDIFSHYASSIGYNFDAQYIDLLSIDEENNGIIVILTLSSKNAYIEERVEYDI